MDKIKSYTVYAGEFGVFDRIRTYSSSKQAELHASQLRADGWESFVKTIRWSI